MVILGWLLHCRDTEALAIVPAKCSTVPRFLMLIKNDDTLDFNVLTKNVDDTYKDTV